MTEMNIWREVFFSFSSLVGLFHLQIERIHIERSRHEWPAFYVYQFFARCQSASWTYLRTTHTDAMAENWMGRNAKYDVWKCEPIVIGGMIDWIKLWWISRDGQANCWFWPQNGALSLSACVCVCVYMCVHSTNKRRPYYERIRKLWMLRCLNSNDVHFDGIFESIVCFPQFGVAGKINIPGARFHFK